MKTVFIIGAGASQEAGLPVGNQLTGLIANHLDFEFDSPNRQKKGSEIIKAAFDWGGSQKDHRCSDINALVDASRIIRNAMHLAPSIDNFIHAHNDNKLIELCGKLAIAQTILDAERSSKLAFKEERLDSTIDFAKTKDTWYADFARLLVVDGALAETKKRLSETAFIVFNYDRCIEHYLYHYLQSYFNLQKNDAADIVKSVKIFHPYGSVGNLPWYDAAAPIKFGENPTGKKLFQLASELRTFTEGANEQTTKIELARKHLNSAERLVFLGFAFHRLNMELLVPAGTQVIRIDGRKGLATAKGFSVQDQDQIRWRLGETFHISAAQTVGALHMGDWTCHEMFQKNNFGLSLV